MMRWCTAQKNEYDLQAKTHPNVCSHHKLHNNNENKKTEKYDNNGNVGYFMSYHADKRGDGRTDRRTDGWTDGQSHRQTQATTLLGA